MDFGGARKRGRPEAASFNGNGGFKKSKQGFTPFFFILVIYTSLLYVYYFLFTSLCFVFVYAVCV